MGGRIQGIRMNKRSYLLTPFLLVIGNMKTSLHTKSLPGGRVGFVKIDHSSPGLFIITI